MTERLNCIFNDLKKLKNPDLNCNDIYKVSIDEWFGNLRLINTYEVLEHVTTFLQQTNQYKFPTKDRIYLLEKLQVPIFSLVEEVKTGFLNTNLPLTAENNEHIHLCLTIYEQFIQAYSIILCDQLNNTNRLSSLLNYINNNIILTFQRIIRYTSLIILTNFELYQLVDNSLWNKLYNLFSYSEEKKYSHKLIFDPIVKKKINIKSTFMQILFLALSDPYRYNQQQINYIYDHLTDWTKQVNIVTKKHKSYCAICFSSRDMPMLELNDNPPDKLSKDKRLLYFDAHKLSLQKLNKDNELTSIFLSPGVKHTLLTQLKNSWTSSSERSYKRSDYQKKIKAVIGIRDIHYVLNSYKQPKWLELSKISTNNETENDYEQMLQSVSSTNTEKQSYSERKIIHTFLSKNKSSNGLSLIWADNYSVNVKIGDMVAFTSDLSDKPKPKSWVLGVIRQINNFYNQPLKL